MGITPKIPKQSDAWRGIHGARVYATLSMIRRLTAGVDDGGWWARTAALIEEADDMMRQAMNVPEDWRTRPAP